MGCDIHLYVERREGGSWRTADKWSAHGQGRTPDVAYDDQLYTDRNYDLFAILADVRNRNDIEPIVAPRGLPADACAEVRTAAESWDLDGHSHSHLSLRELLEFDWTKSFNRGGYVGLEEFARWVHFKQGPTTYAGDVGGAVIKTTNERMRTLVDQWDNTAGELHRAFAADCGHIYTHLTWPVTYAAAARTDWWIGIVPKLLKLAGSLATADDVRIVFWFDN